MIHLLVAIIGMIMLGVLFGSIALWAKAIGRLAVGEPLLSLEPRRPVPWGMVDVVLVFEVVIAAIVVAQLLAARYFDLPADLPPEKYEARHLAVALFSSSLAMFAGCAAALGILLLRGATWRDLGLQVGKIFSDVKLGATAFVMIAPPVYLLQLALTRIWPSEHPLVTLMKSDPQPVIIAGAAFTAVVVAPLTEEMFFRLIFQGWLQKFATLAVKLQGGYYDMSIAGAEQSRCDARAVFLCDASDRPFSLPNVAADAEDGKPPEETQPADAEEALDEILDNAKAPPHAAEQQALLMATDENAANPSPPDWPIVVSAAIFALLHWGHGPDPLPLFFLAVGLGYVYHRTHRILPCIMVHFLVNSMSMVALIMYLLAGGETP